MHTTYHHTGEGDCDDDTSDNPRNDRQKLYLPVGPKDALNRVHDPRQRLVPEIAREARVDVERPRRSLDVERGPKGQQTSGRQDVDRTQ